MIPTFFIEYLGGKKKKNLEGDSDEDCFEESDEFDDGAEHDYISSDSSEWVLDLKLLYKKALFNYLIFNLGQQLTDSLYILLWILDVFWLSALNDKYKFVNYSLHKKLRSWPTNKCQQDLLLM